MSAIRTKANDLRMLLLKIIGLQKRPPRWNCGVKGMNPGALVMNHAGIWWQLSEVVNREGDEKDLTGQIKHKEMKLFLQGMLTVLERK